MRSKIKWIVALLFLMSLIYGSYTLSQYVMSGDVKKRQADVIIDAGHGGSDPGKVGVNKALEKDINLKIAKKVEKLLKKEGVTVIMTREKDEGLSGGGKGSNKIQDMKARVKMINEIKPKIAVSIHQNSYQTEGVKGAQVFYYSHSKEGEREANMMQETLREVDPSNTRQAKANDTYYLLKRTEVPTIIVECGFLSNWEEAKKLTDETYQDAMAKAVSKGILSSLTKEK